MPAKGLDSAAHDKAVCTEAANIVVQSLLKTNIARCNSQQCQLLDYRLGVQA